MIRTQIYLPEDLKLQLLVYSQQEELPVSEIVRRSITKELGKKNKVNAGSTLLKIASMATKKGPKDLSTNIFEYLYGEKSDYAKDKRKSIK